MRKNTGSRISTLVIIMMIGAIFFAGKPQPVSGQTTGREFACGCFTCYKLDPNINYLYFDDGTKTVGKPCTGILAEDACPAEMGRLPDKGKSFCEKIKEKYQFSSFKDSCPTLAGACEPFEKQPPPKETQPVKPDNPESTPEPTPEPLSVASAATEDTVEVMIRCPGNVHSISVNWPNDLDGSYSGAGSGNLNFKYRTGSDRMNVQFLKAWQSGQTIICEYNFSGASSGQYVPHVAYEYKVKREIVGGCFQFSNGMKCRVKP